MSDHTKLQHFIGGEWVAPTSGEYFESTNPATRKVLYHAARGNAADVSAAVDSAQATFEDPRWRDLSQTRRGHLLRRLGDLIGEHAEEFARSESQDNGKLLREMRGQLNTLPEYYYYYAGLADKIHGAVVPTSDRKVLNYTSREPLGVVGAITPWNSPLTLTTSKLAPALCVGNTVVIKPSEYTSATVLRLAELVIEAGFPPGAVNIVTGFGVEAGQPLVDHPALAKISFTGSTATGARRPVHRVHPRARRQIAQHRVRGRQRRERRDGCGGRDLRRRRADLHRRQPRVRTSGGLRRAARAGDGTGPQHPHR
jgi:acyl-CoA reductase-like NAD-dependent aldehyde dehydrogenase